MGSESGTKHLASDLIERGQLEICDGYRAKNSEMASDGLPFVRVANVNNGIQTDNIDLLGWPSVKRAGTKVARPGDVVFTAKGTVGRHAFVTKSIPKFVYSPQLCYWRSLDPEFLVPRFLYYWIQGHEFTMQSSAVKGQTDMADYVSLTDMRRMRITVPDPSEQRRIAHILGTLDDKIELNRRTNETMEAMARVLFKSWFVDFDPVRAKAAGRQPKGMDADTATLFPDSFEESELGVIPKGWRATTWGNLVELAYGKALRDYKSSSGPVQVFGTNGPIGWTDRPLSNEPTVIIGRKGAYRGVHFASGPSWTIDTAFFVRPNKSMQIRWAYYAIRQHDINEMDSGSAIPSTSRNAFYALGGIEPSSEVQDAFQRILRPIWEKQAHNTSEAEHLGGVRYFLLPRLLSGELADTGAEPATEATG